ncbi:MAG TPA: nucleotidyltransferase [Leeuwenhoekiella sp.]|nr:nucleotidyltransferase [Leeuwenhoekiella sp.]
MLSKKEIKQKLEFLMPELREKYGVEKIGLFGSFSQNEETEDSDIDLLVSFSRSVGWGYCSLSLYLEEVFDRKVDLVTQRAIRPMMKKSILKQV